MESGLTARSKFECLNHDLNLIKLIILEAIDQVNKKNQDKIVVQTKKMILKFEIWN
jgi:hypothetical protein